MPRQSKGAKEKKMGNRERVNYLYSLAEVALSISAGKLSPERAKRYYLKQCENEVQRKALAKRFETLRPVHERWEEADLAAKKQKDADQEFVSKFLSRFLTCPIRHRPRMERIALSQFSPAQKSLFLEFKPIMLEEIEKDEKMRTTFRRRRSLKNEAEVRKLIKLKPHEVAIEDLRAIAHLVIEYAQTVSCGAGRNRKEILKDADLVPRQKRILRERMDMIDECRRRVRSIKRKGMIRKIT